MKLRKTIVDGTLIIPQALVDPFLAFLKEHRIHHYWTDPQKRRLAQALYGFCEQFFNSELYLTYIPAYQDFVDNVKRSEMRCEHEHFAIETMLKRCGRLNDFYKLNSGCGRAIKDRRYRLFLVLRTDAKFVLNFLIYRTKKIDRKATRRQS